MRNFNLLLQAFLSAWKSTCAAKGAATLVIPPQKTFLQGHKYSH